MTLFTVNQMPGNITSFTLTPRFNELYYACSIGLLYILELVREEQ